jgi:hypothetical protein
MVAGRIKLRDGFACAQESCGDYLPRPARGLLHSLHISGTNRFCRQYCPLFAGQTTRVRASFHSRLGPCVCSFVNKCYFPTAKLLIAKPSHSFAQLYQAVHHCPFATSLLTFCHIDEHISCVLPFTTTAAYSVLVDSSFSHP